MVRLKDFIPAPAGLRLLGGGILSATIDGVMQAVYVSDPATWSGKFPFVPTIDPLPQADDWIVLGVSAAPYIFGKATKREKIADVGGGMLAYAIPMFIHRIIVRAAAMAASPAPAGAPATAPIRISPSPTPAPAPPVTPTGAVKFN